MEQESCTSEQTLELNVDSYRESVNVRVVIRRFLFHYLATRNCRVDVPRFLVWCNEFPFMEYNFATYFKIRFN